jgi:threonine synthase
LPSQVLSDLRSRYDAFASDDAETLATIKRVFADTGRILDPHAAVAAAAAARFEAGPKVVLATAHPAKFSDAVRRAIGQPPPVPPALAALDKLPEKLDVLPNKLPLLRQFISSRLAA